MTLLFYLVSLTEPELFTNSYRHAFLWVHPVIFFAYCLWDLIEHYEYRGTKHEPIVVSQRTKSMLGLYAMVFQSAIYITFGNLAISQQWISLNMLYLIFTISTLGIVLAYRFDKTDLRLTRIKYKRRIRKGEEDASLDKDAL